MQGFVFSFCSSNDKGNLFSPFQTHSSEAGDWIKIKSLVLDYFLHKIDALM